jgi:ABC-2 type transport system permease protein
MARRAWSTIAVTGIRGLMARKAFLALLLVAWLPFVARTIQIYAATSLPQAAFLAMTPQTFRQFLSQQDVWVFFITVYVGSGLIANDRRTNALQLYLSKPLTRADYVAGKLAILMTFVLLVTCVPALLLLVVQVAFAGSAEFVRENTYLFPAIAAYTFIEALLAGVTMLALSSLSKNSRYVGILYAGLLFFSQAMFVVLKTSTGRGWWSFLSMANNLNEIGDVMFGVRVRGAAPPAVSAAMVMLLIVVAAAVLERRVRGLEVVA